MGPAGRWLGRNRASWHGIGWLIALLWAGAGCDDRLVTTVASTESVVQLRDPVPRPASVVGTFVAPSLQRTHDLARTHYGAAPILVGRSWAGSVASLVGLPITTAEHVDTRSPVRLAITAGPRHGFAIAVPLLHPDRLLVAATAGENAPFRSERIESVGLDRLTARDETRRLPLGVAATHLIVASSEEVLLELGAFVGDPVSATFVTPDASDTTAIVGTIDTLPFAAWGGAAAADVPLPSPLSLPVGLAASLAHVGSVDVTVTIDERAIEVLVASGSGLIEGVGLGAGPVDGLLALPAETELGQLTFLGANLREREARATRASLDALLGSDALEAPSLIETALVALALARKDDLAIGYERGPRGPMIYGAMGLRSKPAAEAALDAIVEALASKEVQLSLERRGVELTAKRTVMERIGEAYRVRVRSKRGDMPRESSESSADVGAFAIQLDEERGYFGAGVDPGVALTRARGLPEGASRLGQLEAVRQAATRLGPRVSLAYFIDPARLAQPRPVGDVERTRSVALIALAPGDRGATLRVVIDPEAFAAIASRFR